MSALALFLLAVAPAGTATAPAIPRETVASDPAKVAAAERLIDASDFEGTLDRTFVQIVPLFAQSVIGAMGSSSDGDTVLTAIRAKDRGEERLIAILSQEFMTAMKQQYPALKRQAAEEYAKAFSLEELDAIAAFYATGPGAKTLRLIPEIQQRMAIAGRALGEKAGTAAGKRAFERAAQEILNVSDSPKA